MCIVQWWGTPSTHRQRLISALHTNYTADKLLKVREYSNIPYAIIKIVTPTLRGSTFHQMLKRAAQICFAFGPQSIGEVKHSCQLVHSEQRSSSERCWMGLGSALAASSSLFFIHLILCVDTSGSNGLSLTAHDSSHLAVVGQVVGQTVHLWLCRHFCDFRRNAGLFGWDCHYRSQETVRKNWLIYHYHVTQN